jgi:AcrR family transcriptional regulator
MPRPSHNLDLKLIAAAREMLPGAGFSGLKIRDVARRAGVNPGMFHYHFKTQEAFRRRIVQDVYEDFLSSFVSAADGPGGARARLRRVLVAVARFARDNRVFYTLMIRELLNAQPDMSAFAKKNFPRHAAVLMKLLEECRREGVVRPLPMPMLAAFAMGSMCLPNVWVTAMERNGVRRLGEKPLSELARALLSDELIEARADMVLAGLARGRA